MPTKTVEDGCQVTVNVQPAVTEVEPLPLSPSFSGKLTSSHWLKKRTSPRYQLIKHENEHHPHVHLLLPRQSEAEKYPHTSFDQQNNPCMYETISVVSLLIRPWMTTRMTREDQWSCNSQVRSGNT